MRKKHLMPKRLVIVAATVLVMGGGIVMGNVYFADPSYACVSGTIGNPGNNKFVGKAGDHPPGGGNGGSITGDRGNSR
jgi:hypothetical protein